MKKISLQALLDINERGDFSKNDVSEERLMTCLPQLQEQIAFYRAYPDLFIDDLTGFSQWDETKDGPWKGFRFYYYQRVDEAAPLLY